MTQSFISSPLDSWIHLFPSSYFGVQCIQIHAKQLIGHFTVWYTEYDLVNTTEELAVEIRRCSTVVLDSYTKSEQR